MQVGTQPFDPWSFRRPELPELTETIESVDQPGVTFVLRLRGLDAIQTAAALQEASELIAEHIGSEDTEEEPVPFLAPDAAEYTLNRLLIRDICFIRSMQPEAERFSFTWWLGVALNMPSDYGRISKLAATLHKKVKPGGNSPKAASSTAG